MQLKRVLLVNLKCPMLFEGIFRYWSTTAFRLGKLNSGLIFIRAHIHKNLSTLTSQVHTQNLRSCFNLRFQIEEFVDVLRCKIYILNEKAINLSIT